MISNQQQVQNWWKYGRDYNSGVKLLEQFNNNKTLIKVLEGRSHRYQEKLEYELCKAVGLNWKEMQTTPVVDIPAIKVVKPKQKAVKKDEPTVPVTEESGKQQKKKNTQRISKK